MQPGPCGAVAVYFERPPYLVEVRISVARPPDPKAVVGFVDTSGRKVMLARRVARCQIRKLSETALLTAAGR
jgi:hypothetical protein